jgi:L-threonylcarbamoyladenylate synthase
MEGGTPAAGPISAEELGAQAASGHGIEAPGQLASHYAPTKPLRLDALEARPGEWLIGFGAVAGHATLSAAGDLTEAAARLFNCLHQADAAAHAPSPSPRSPIMASAPPSTTA